MRRMITVKIEPEDEDIGLPSLASSLSTHMGGCISVSSIMPLAALTRLWRLDITKCCPDLVVPPSLAAVVQRDDDDEEDEEWEEEEYSDEEGEGE